MLIALPLLTMLSGCHQAPEDRVCVDARVPSNRVEDHDPNAPLLIALADGPAAHDALGVAGSIALTNTDGSDVEFVLSSSGSVIGICPLGGLRSDAMYVWRVDDMTTDSSNSISNPFFNQTGSWVFSTGGQTEFEPINSEWACRTRLKELELPCYDHLMVDVDETGLGGVAP